MDNESYFRNWEWDAVHSLPISRHKLIEQGRQLDLPLLLPEQTKQVLAGTVLPQASLHVSQCLAGTSFPPGRTQRAFHLPPQNGFRFMC